MKREADDAHLDAALNPDLLEGASELNTLLQEGGGSGEAGEADAAAAAAGAARPLAAKPLANVDVARRVVPLWRSFVAERKGVMLLRLLELPDLFEEVLKRLDPRDRTMIAQVGRPWLGAVLDSDLPRLPKGVRVRLRLEEFSTSVERLAWAKANGCPWNTRATELAALGGHLERCCGRGSTAARGNII